VRSGVLDFRVSKLFSVARTRDAKDLRAEESMQNRYGSASKRYWTAELAELTLRPSELGYG